MSWATFDSARRHAYERRAQLRPRAERKPAHLRYRCPRGIYGHVTVLVADTDYSDIGGRVVDPSVVCLDCPWDEQQGWWALQEKGERW